ncbi:serine/threonine-protein kinase [Amycolatopsis sp.]|uniref:serine/threonine-protein kinase n=1 Tax=Amycolatopsis sp. TaxID=37632 RepID=UPI002E0B089E|nr:serine/threonine-protein kinase [Amycolatopsis sp.]
MSEEIREIAGRYRLIARIGGGAMGVVWQAKDIQLDRVVAVKELLMPFGQGEEKAEEAKNRAMREARIAARLQHPHAISVFNVVEDGDRPWLIMEYLPSKSLADVIKADGARPIDEVIGIACQLASALTVAHEAGIVHRDVKPGNILLGEDGTVKVTDFGISRAIGDVTLTATGEIAGTPAFLAPEVARGDEASFASDVFSLGATMYTAVEGKPPFGYGDNAIALLYRVSSGDIVPPAQAGKIEPLMLRLLAMEPTDRPTMKQALEELEAFGVTGGSMPTVRELPPPEPVAAVASASDGPSKKRLGVALIGVVVLAAIIAAALIAAHNAGTETAAPTNSPTPSASVSVTPTSDAAVPPPVASPPSSPSTPPTSASSPTTTNVPTGPEAQVKAVTDYYGLVEAKNLQASFAGLSDNFKSSKNQNFEKYSAFWNRFSAVSVSDVTPAGGNAVNANVTFTEKGATSTERHRYAMVEQNGKWLIDSQAMR